jgi:hypothetical protein
MFRFDCIKRKQVFARGDLRLPVFTIVYTRGPSITHHKVFRVNLYGTADKNGRRNIYEKVPMRVAQKCLRENVDNIKSKSWDHDRFEAKLFFVRPVRVGAWNDVEYVVLTYTHHQLQVEKPALVVDLTHEAD